MRSKVKVSAAALLTVLAVGAVSATPAFARAKDASVTITYWQYSYPSKVTAINNLIQQFEKANPNIKVVAQDFPYDQYNQKIAAAMYAGKGPDIMNLYMGWIPQYVQQGYLQPIPSNFMSTRQIDHYYVPMVQDSKLNAQYYALPIAVRSLSLFYNKDMFKQYGIKNPPTTWDELIADAKKMTVYNNGNLTQEGFVPEVNGQGYHIFEEVLLRQWGVTPFTNNHKTVLWNKSPQGLEAFKYWMNMFTTDKIGDPNFDTDYETAFKAGKAAMIIDGSFAINSMKQAAQFPWGVTTLPTKTQGGLQSNFGSYWVNGIAKGVTGPQLNASEKFLKFLISTNTQKYWLNSVGELPAASDVLLSDKSIKTDPVYGPFVKGLSVAHSTYFVDETNERQAFTDETNKILLTHAPVDQVFNELVAKEQAIRDKYFNSNH